MAVDSGLRTIPISGPRDGMELVIRDSMQWRALWPGLADMPENVRPIAAVDFGTDVVVVVALGQRAGADFVRVYSVVRQSKITVVHYTASIQVRTCMNRGSGGMFSTPAVAVRLVRPPGPILFDRRIIEPAC